MCKMRQGTSSTYVSLRYDYASLRTMINFEKITELAEKATCDKHDVDRFLKKIALFCSKLLQMQTCCSGIATNNFF